MRRSMPSVHVRKLTDASYRGGGFTKSGYALFDGCVDVSDEPVILSLPEMVDRDFTFELGCHLRSFRPSVEGFRNAGFENGRSWYHEQNMKWLPRE
jgi:hypothetical protein